MRKFIAMLLVALLTGCSQVDESKIPLTEEELAFIASNPSVLCAMEENRPPYIFVEGGDPKGLSLDYLKLIAKKTGLKFQPVKTGSFQSSLAALTNKKVDVITAVRPTPELTSFMGFTPPFATQGGVFIFRINTLPRSPMTAGILKDSAAKEYLQKRFPDMNLIETEDDEQSISLLQKGLLDGLVTDGGTATFLTAKAGVRTRTAIINFDYPYTIGYRKEDVVLGSILTKAVASISPEDKTKLNSKWLAEEK